MGMFWKHIIKKGNGICLNPHFIILQLFSYIKFWTYEPHYEKTGFFICVNKDADQLRGNREADQHLCFHYTDSTIPLLPKSEISILWLSSLAVQPGLCRTRSEIPKTGFLTTRLIYARANSVDPDQTAPRGAG